MRGVKWTKTNELRLLIRKIKHDIGFHTNNVTFGSYKDVTVYTRTEEVELLQQKEVSGPDERWVDVPIVKEEDND